MPGNLLITSINVQGIGDTNKRRDVLNCLKSKHSNIVCLQDTHLTEKYLFFTRSIWGYECYFNNFSSQSRGVAIFINNNFDYSFQKMETDDQGNFIILHFLSYEKDITLFCIYGPNKDEPVFYESIKNKLSTIENDCIFVGDFNLVMSPQKDYFNYLHVNNPKSRDKVLEIVLEYNLIDCWREEHIEERKYTWFQKKSNKTR